MQPESYLINGEDIDPSLAGICLIGMMPHPPGVFGQFTMFLLGDTFLRNFYSVYDFENQSVKLAVNKHAEGYVRIVERQSKSYIYWIIMAVLFLATLLANYFIRRHIDRKLNLATAPKPKV